MRDAEPLAHAERVVAHPAVGLLLGEADPVQHLLDPERGQAHGALGDGEDLPPGAAGVLGRGVEQDADLEAGVGQVGEQAAGDRGALRTSGGVSPTMTRMVVDLPAPLGPRKPVTRPGSAVKVTSSTAVKLPYVFVRQSTVIMGKSLVATGAPAHQGRCWARPLSDPRAALGVAVRTP